MKHEDLKLGQIITGNQRRDAIHMAIAPVTANEILISGQHVGMLKNGNVGRSKTPIGVVDPFLTDTVSPGEKCWMFLYPNTITSMYHEWQHPAFPSEQAHITDTAYSEKWLRLYAMKMNTYDDAEAAYKNLLDGLRDRELYAHGTDLHSASDLEDEDELFKHAEVVLGQKFSIGEFTFTCSC